MAIGYNLIQPNGKVKKQRVQTEKERDDVVKDQLNRWEEYCDKNWISVNHEDPFCAENRVKLFQNSLAYCLMLGNTGGIVTNYKEVADGKREIPISSCPSYIENIVYGTGASLVPVGESEDMAFQSTLDRLDEKAQPYTPKAKRKSCRKKSDTRYDKIHRIKSRMGDTAQFYYPTVNTENCFELSGILYQIDESVSEYKGKIVGEGDVLYDMDKIICVIDRGDTYFFDMNWNEIPANLVRIKSF